MIDNCIWSVFVTKWRLLPQDLNTASQMSAAGCQPTGSSWIVRRQNWSGCRADSCSIWMHSLSSYDTLPIVLTMAVTRMLMCLYMVQLLSFCVVQFWRRSFLKFNQHSVSDEVVFMYNMRLVVTLFLQEDRHIGDYNSLVESDVWPIELCCCQWPWLAFKVFFLSFTRWHMPLSRTGAEPCLAGWPNAWPQRWDKCSVVRHHQACVKCRCCVTSLFW